MAEVLGVALHTNLQKLGADSVTIPAVFQSRWQLCQGWDPFGCGDSDHVLSVTSHARARGCSARRLASPSSAASRPRQPRCSGAKDSGEEREPGVRAGLLYPTELIQIWGAKAVPRRREERRHWCWLLCALTCSEAVGGSANRFLLWPGQG